VRHHSGVQAKGARAPSPPPPPPAERNSYVAPLSPRARQPDVRWVPLIIDRRPLLHEPTLLITAMLLEWVNGVLTVDDLAEVTGIPLGAVMDALLALEQRGVILIERRTSQLP
jgi:predicted Rossmann fold nucleotide-binding protein DprA/Smf involved in DNA uptake